MPEHQQRAVLEQLQRNQIKWELANGVFALGRPLGLGIGRR
jgi:hypothetical protein